MLTSTFVFMTILPLQISPSSKPALVLDRPLIVAAVVDCARILGLPKLKLRDSNGNRYQAEKIIMQEPLAILQTSSDQMAFNQTGLRKAYIQSYVKR
ncbi:hypothetical protein [Polynucleobacter sp. AP-Ainpum-60-G11]|uniref:hypothetical protein n=1 Tax=Polynucleobacter sp. AP-Ainpum-60-G11 TaxID=2576926 RepID=UPI001BFDADDC|nr:hypothetical protein [Polynucleobacter sp. AP-Ainpum-60-G11]QWE25986.1 hypothetical protein FD971_05855 [Polynucleobacter sp. AP-Ainpum-60-G11]